jgi:hypothetical protein
MEETVNHQDLHLIKSDRQIPRSVKEALYSAKLETLEQLTKITLYDLAAVLHGSGDSNKKGLHIQREVHAGLLTILRVLKRHRLPLMHAHDTLDDTGLSEAARVKLASEMFIAAADAARVYSGARSQRYLGKDQVAREITYFAEIYTRTGEYPLWRRQ